MTTHAWLLLATDFADQAMVLPLALVMTLVLWRAGWRRGAWSWVRVVPGTLLAVGVAKILVFRFGAPFGLLSPSGHTASAGLVYGGLLGLVLPGGWAWAGSWRRGAAFALPLALGIGLTRLALDVHTPADVVVGGAFGVAGAGLLTQWAGRRPDGVSLWPPAVLFLIVTLLFHGLRMPAEGWLRQAAHDWSGWPL
jgi:membrane-associated phospholipid phosphatase